MENVLTKNDLARKIAKKYKTLTIPDCEAMIDLIIDEILDIVLNERKTVNLCKLCTIGLKYEKVNGYNFKENKHESMGLQFKAFCVPNYYLKEQAKILSPNGLEDIGLESSEE